MQADVLNYGVLNSALVNQLLSNQLCSTSSTLPDIQDIKLDLALMKVINALKVSIQNIMGLFQQTASIFDQSQSMLLPGNSTASSVEFNQSIGMGASLTALKNSMSSANFQKMLELIGMRGDQQKKIADMPSNQTQGQADLPKQVNAEIALNNLWNGFSQQEYWRKGKSERADQKDQEALKASGELDRLTSTETATGDLSIDGGQQKEEQQNKNKKQQQEDNDQEDPLALDLEKPDLQLFSHALSLSNELKAQDDLSDPVETVGYSIKSIFDRGRTNFNAPKMQVSALNVSFSETSNVFDKVYRAFQMCCDWQSKIVNSLADEMKGQTDFSKLLASYEVFLNRKWQGVKTDGFWEWKDKDGKIHPKMQEIIKTMKENNITISDDTGDMTIDEWLKKKEEEDKDKDKDKGQRGRLKKDDVWLLVRTISNESKKWADLSNRTQTDVSKSMQVYSVSQDTMISTLSLWYRTLKKIADAMGG